MVLHRWYFDKENTIDNLKLKSAVLIFAASRESERVVAEILNYIGALNDGREKEKEDNIFKIIQKAKL